METNQKRPHPYGDCDACGNPQRLIDAIAAEGERLGVDLGGIDAFNSWDMSMPLGGRSAAGLLVALRQATQPVTEAQTDALMLELVDGIDGIGG